MKYLLLFVLLMLGSALYAQSFTGKPQYEIDVRRADTSMGKIVVEMFPAIAPNHVRNWDSLVAIKFYDSVAFHRVVPGFVIQGGDPNSRSGEPETWGYGEPGQRKINAEFSAVSHRRGILSAARLGNDINSATSQFFICVANATTLDRKYSVYGRTVSGMDVVDEIVNAETDGSEHPLEKISMFITRIGSNDSLTATPQLVSPVNDSTQWANSKITLRWNKVSDAMLYRVQILNSFSNIVLDSSLRQVDTSLTVNNLPLGFTYRWHVLANNGGHASEYSSAWSFNLGELAVDDVARFDVVLSDVYPNPVRNEASIGFSLEEGALVRLTVLDVLGRSIRQLIATEYISAGSHEVLFDTHNLAAGVYLYCLEAGGKSVTKRMIVE